ncbi:MAG: hypothetical protein IPP25_01220 [Saprospiraceae bacterium]|nr:hypothetical protein [Candidatus Opimibacter skivensis]
MSDLGNLLISNYSTNDLYAECTDDLLTTIEIVIKDCSNGIKSDCITKYNIFELLNELVAASTALEAKNKTISYGVLNRINSIKRNTERYLEKVNKFNL